MPSDPFDDTDKSVADADAVNNRKTRRVSAQHPASGYLPAKAETLQSILDSLADGVVVADQNGRFLYFNPMAEKILGSGSMDVPPDQWTSAYGCYLPDGITPYPPERLPLVRSMRGEEVIDEELHIRNSHLPSGIWINASSRPLKDEHGILRGGVVVFRDVTEQKVTSEMIRRLSAALEQTADSVLITDKEGIIEYVNPAFERTTGFKKEEVLGQTPRILKSDRYGRDFYRKLWATILGGGHFQDTFLNRKKSGELYWVEQTITPMKNREGRITHFVSVLKDVTELKKREEQEVQLRLAREVQQQLYPRSPLTLPEFDIAGAAYPADATGGDYFDYFSIAGSSLVIAVGDVSGHGLASALLMAGTRAYLRAFTWTRPDVSEVLNYLNCALSPDLHDGQFVALLLVRLDFLDGSLVYGNAGHIPGYLLDSAGRIKLVLESTGIPVGLFPDRHVHSGSSVPLDPGDVLVFLTDGITEAKAFDDADFTAERALEVVRSHRDLSAREIVEKICASVRAYFGDQPQLDDITCVICKIKDIGSRMPRGGLT